MKLSLPISCLALFAGACMVGSEESPDTERRSTAPEVRAAIERTLPLMQSSMQTWIEEVDCTSCHHQGLGTMTVVLARERGFFVDEDLHERQIERMAAKTPEGYAANLQGDAGINASFGRSYQFLALAAAGYPQNGITDVGAYYLAGNPSDAGAWLSESYRPPLEATPFTSTALATRALALYGLETRALEIAEKILRGREWLERTVPRDNEERTMRLLGLAWNGASAGVVRGAADDLLAMQRADGGWAQLATLESDAYATGQALVVLQQLGGLSTTSEVYRKGVRFLLDAQLEDGSWRVESRRRSPGLPYFESGFPHQMHQFISFAATAWATMALCIAFDPRPSVVFHGGRPPRAEVDTFARDQGMLDVHLAAAFGSLDELRGALANGSPVDARGPGGVTPLMLAVHDEAKIALLLEHGADVNAVSESGTTALVNAGWYSGALPVVEMLLGRGADPGAHGLEGMTALVQAARTGQPTKVARLLHATAPSAEATSERSDALLAAAFRGNVEMARLLIDAGADLEVRWEGQTPLALASYDGKVDLVRLLLERGANVEAADEDGMTPLAWAAKVEHGHTEVVDALLRAGANPELTEKNGRTPADWARMFDNALVLEVLRNASARE